MDSHDNCDCFSLVWRDGNALSLVPDMVAQYDADADGPAHGDAAERDADADAVCLDERRIAVVDVWSNRIVVIAVDTCAAYSICEDCRVRGPNAVRCSLRCLASCFVCRLVCDLNGPAVLVGPLFGFDASVSSLPRLFVSHHILHHRRLPYQAKNRGLWYLCNRFFLLSV